MKQKKPRLTTLVLRVTVTLADAPIVKDELTGALGGDFDAIYETKECCPTKKQVKAFHDAFVEDAT